MTYLSGFNPTMVRLLRDMYVKAHKPYNSFNPTMVRLLPPASWESSNLSAAVSIPQWCDCCQAQLIEPPACHRVSIPQWCDCCRFQPYPSQSRAPCFNPTMVRLLRVAGNFHRPLPWFQSHNGAIAARGETSTCRRKKQFQSHNGAIAAIQVAAIGTSHPPVSIPQWCDCCQFG